MKQRPQYHVTPWRNWMNDPNGLIFDGRNYHVFYQHNPEGHEWGPMHWGHSTSKDLYRWRHRPIALYPDENGTCFSGSAILDVKNHSGLMKKDNVPILLFYTSHPEEPADDGRHYQSQSLAYSDDGKRFTKHEGNPILPNQGEADFRDPKVFYYEEGGFYIMVLAAGDHIAFYRSDNLLEWTHLSDFGPGENSIDGVWECPDLFPLQYKKKTYWILIVSMGTNHAQGRSVTQYFVGDFDGTSFASLEQTPHSRLIDEGTDNYAGVTFSGTNEPIVMGWAMNWGYAADTPTKGYVGQMTAPRTMSLYRDTSGHISLASLPVRFPKDAIASVRMISKSPYSLDFKGCPLVMEFTPDDADPSFELTFRNDNGEHLHVWQDQERNLTVDRTYSGPLDYHEMLDDEFYRKRMVQPRTKEPGKFTVMLDGPLLEVYADDGTRVFTMTAYPEEPYNKMELRTVERAYGRVGILEDYEPSFAKNPFKNRPDGKKL